MVHSPPYEDWDVTLSIGNTLAFEACIRSFLARGDSIIMDEYAYTSGVYACRPQGLNIVGIGMDGEGMRADLLDERLSNWKESEGRKPTVAYIVPYCSSRWRLSLERDRIPRARVCLFREGRDCMQCFRNTTSSSLKTIHIVNPSVLDLTTDFLQMEPYTGEENPKYTTPKDSKQLISNLIPSFLSLDVDGRVVRLDSLSKVLAPGIRLAFITASAQLVERLVRFIEITSQAPSGFSQSIAYQLLSQHWGHEGFFQWLIYMRSEYTKRRDVCCRAIDKYLPEEVMEYTVPVAGMFFWIHIIGSIKGFSSKELGEKVFNKCLEEKVLMVPGHVFKAEKSEGKDELYFRGTFAAVPLDKLEMGIQRLGKALRDVFDL
jgi:aromatic amino acid aminotransferase I / 2-aminoadipate transaminase